MYNWIICIMELLINIGFISSFMKMYCRKEVPFCQFAHHQPVVTLSLRDAPLIHPWSCIFVSGFLITLVNVGVFLPNTSPGAQPPHSVVICSIDCHQPAIHANIPIHTWSSHVSSVFGIKWDINRLIDREKLLIIHATKCVPGIYFLISLPIDQ